MTLFNLFICKRTQKFLGKNRVYLEVIVYSDVIIVTIRYFCPRAFQDSMYRILIMKQVQVFVTTLESILGCDTVHFFHPNFVLI